MLRAVPADPEGQIPFRIRIGVTGHINLPNSPRLGAVVREEIQRIWNTRLGLPAVRSTPVELAVVSALAKGADRIVVREALAEGRHRGRETRLEVILPMERHAYAHDQGFDEDPHLQKEFDDLLGEATLVNELLEAQGEYRYKHGGQGVVNRSDVLIVLWNGKASGGPGGTAETLLYAAARWRPCIWISTEEDHAIRNNFGRRQAAAFLGDVRHRANVDPERAQIGEPQTPEPGSVLDSLAETFEALRRFNGVKLPEDFPARRDARCKSKHDDPSWVVAPNLRAALAAARNQKAFNLATWAMCALAIAAASALGLGIALPDLDRSLAGIELGLLVILLAAFWLARRRAHWHGRWLSYRLLAERLRTARFLAPTGVNFSRVAALRDVFVERQSADWVQRAFEEVWDSRPRAGQAHEVSEVESESLRAWLAKDWIQAQIDYHSKARKLHERRYTWQTRLVGALFLATPVVVALHVAGVAADWMTAASIVLPVSAAALGAILTMRQHRALAERFTRMEIDLQEAKQNVSEANEKTLHRASTDAARIIAAESGDWFGALWFLDIEHPP